MPRRSQPWRRLDGRDLSREPQGTNLAEIATGPEGTFGFCYRDYFGRIIHAWLRNRRFGKGAIRRFGRRKGRRTSPRWVIFAPMPGELVTLYWWTDTRRRIGVDGIVRLVATIAGKVTMLSNAGPSNAPCIWGWR